MAIFEIAYWLNANIVVNYLEIRSPPQNNQPKMSIISALFILVLISALIIIESQIQVRAIEARD